MEQAAEAWRDLATAPRTAWEDTQHYAAYVMAESEGPTADGFQRQVERLVDYNKGSLALTLQAREQTERSYRDQAQAIRDLKRPASEREAAGLSKSAVTIIKNQLTDVQPAGLR